jgi:hypothetical protein
MSRPVLPPIPERDVLYAVSGYLFVKGIFHWRNNTGAYKEGSRYIRYGAPGSSDIIGICPDGRFLAVECKRPRGGRLTEKQREFLGRVNAAGGVGIVATSVEELEKQLKERRVL